jgi:hypothetical protein
MNKSYEEAMYRIQSQQAGLNDLAKRVLTWIIYAMRPLSMAELLHALAIEEGEPGFDEDNLEDDSMVISVCAGLVTLDQASNVVRLVHYTLQEYFLRTRDQWFPDGHTILGKACVTYLSYDVFHVGACLFLQEWEARERAYPLFPYAAVNWGHHLKRGQDGMESDSQIPAFLKNEAAVSACLQAVRVATRGIVAIEFCLSCHGHAPRYFFQSSQARESSAQHRADLRFTRRL